MADQFDRAQDLDAYYRQQALESQRKKMPAGSASAVRCLECGGEIPEARRKALPGCIRCRDCEELFEASHRRS